MENTTQNEVVSKSDTNNNKKREVNRSAAYPFVNIEDSIKFTTQLYNSYAKSFITREDADAVNELGYTNRQLGAANKYGFLTKESEGYKITDLFIKVYKPVNEKEKIESLISAFASPTLNKSLIDSYDGHVLPTSLATILFRQYSIAEKASEDAANIFIQSGKFVSVIDEKNILRFSGKKFEDPIQSIQYAQVITEEDEIEPKQNENINNNDNKQVYQLPQTSNTGYTDEKINLTDNKFSVLKFPNNITLKDIKIISKRLEEIEFRIKEGAE